MNARIIQYRIIFDLQTQITTFILIHKADSYIKEADAISTVLQCAEFNVTHFESRITHLLYTAINTTEHGQVSQCLGFTKSLTSSIQRLGDVLHDNQGIFAISQVHLP